MTVRLYVCENECIRKYRNVNDSGSALVCVSVCSVLQGVPVDVRGHFEVASLSLPPGAGD